LILQCPKCSARYLVPERAIDSDGRNVRCAKCTHTWFHKPVRKEESEALGDLDKLLDEINARPKGLPKGASLPALRGQATWMQKLQTVTAGALALVLALAVIYPQALGMPPSNGLMLADVGIARLADEQTNAYQITGKISNKTGHPMTVPTLRITLVDDDGNALQYWDFSGSEEPIGPWHTLPFNTGNLAIQLEKGTRFVVEIGSPLELPMRRKPSKGT
jgi:predicted Zn finger-like uncharacterized protein